MRAFAKAPHLAVVVLLISSLCCQRPAEGESAICQSARSILLTSDIELESAIKKLDASTNECPQVEQHLIAVAVTLRVYRAALEPQRESVRAKKLISALDAISGRDLLFACDSHGLSSDARVAYKTNFSKVRSLVRDIIEQCPAMQ